YLVRGRLPAGFAASMTGESYFLRVHFYPTTSGWTSLSNASINHAKGMSIVNSQPGAFLGPGKQDF
ncbi:MAG: hypothetical protein ACRYFX_16205, partial [Janthinobacterium lividum]